MYAWRAEEVQHSLLHRMGVCHFKGVASWLDVGLRALRHVRWAPKCSAPQVLNIAGVLPPKLPPGYLDLGWRRSIDKNAKSTRRGRKRQEAVDTMATRTDG